MTNPTYDVIVWGATGFTGRLVAEYLARNYGVAGEVKWALAGRSADKLERLRGELVAVDDKAADLALIVADSHDEASLEAMARQARVVATTVGPYGEYGAPLVGVCARLGVDYCDLTGEVLFMREMIDAHHETAQGSGARIVHTCGFDSIPSDLGCAMVQDFAIEQLGRPCADVTFVVERLKGGVSGGTLATMAATIERIKEPMARKVMGNPYALYPKGAAPGGDRGDLMSARFDAELDVWVGPFVMAAVNTRVVRRTNALSDFRYGADFRYREISAFGAGFKGRMRATQMSVGLKAFGAGMFFSPTRSALQAFVLPSPGEGPSREKREAGMFSIALYGRAAAGAPVDVKGRVVGVKDPGYGETAKMFAEAAICLAADADRARSGGGVLTPATAIGAPLTDRLRRAGMTFTVERAAS